MMIESPAVTPDVWRADQLSQPGQPGCPTGFAELDAQLPGGGWPPGALTELLLPSAGHGEWRLLAPALARLGQAGQWLVWAGSPPVLRSNLATALRPYAPALLDHGLPLSQLLWVDVASSADAAWAAEQALATQGCGAVVCWAPELAVTALRRLHLAARDSHSLLFMARAPAAARQSSPAPLRLACTAAPHRPGQLSVTVLKRRGPPCEQPLQLDTRPLLAPALALHLHRHQHRHLRRNEPEVHTRSTPLAHPIPNQPTRLITDLSTPVADHAAPPPQQPAPSAPVAVPASA